MKVQDLFENEEITVYEITNLDQLKGLEGKIVNVGNDVILDNKKLKSLLLVKFGIVGANFNCSHNYITSLKGAPTKVGGDFNCYYNKLTSLKGAPKEVGGDFNCHFNKLTSLEGAPIKVGGDFNCIYNNLTSLEGAPKEVGRDFGCSHNKLISLEGCPKEIDRNFNCSNNKLTSLIGIHKLINSCEKMHFTGNLIKEGGLGLLLIKNLIEVKGDGPAFEIIQKYVGQGQKGVLPCTKELIEAGYNDFAKL